MGLLEKLWILIAVAIISIVIFTDPKESESGSNNGLLLNLFSSVSRGEKFINRLNWFLILSFFLSTVILGYLAK